MTVTVVPQPLPLDFCGAGQAFEIDRVDYSAPETAGRTGGVQAGFPRWTATWPVGTISRRKSDEVRAFVTSRRGAQRLLYGYEVGREIPRYHQGGIPLGPAPTGWSQAVADDGTVMLMLTGVKPGLFISYGDYVGYVWDGWKRALVRAVSQAGALDDDTITFAIEPAVPAMVPVDATIKLAYADCLMKIDPGQTQIGGIGRRLAVTGGKIVAHQELVP